MNRIGIVVIRPASRALVLSLPGLLGAGAAMAQTAPDGGLVIASAARASLLDGNPILAEAKLPKPAVSAFGDGLGGSRSLTLTLSTELARAAKVRVAAAAGTAGGRDPYAIAVGDFDGDGKPDLAVVNHGSGVSILVNETERAAAGIRYRFAMHQDIGAEPNGIVTGDFNRDGRLDLATANVGDGSLSILLADGVSAGVLHFSTLALPVDGVGPAAIAAGDFNGDGKLDLATANYLGSTVSILLNETRRGMVDARFDTASQPSVAVGSGPYALVVGDFNGDGRPDLATANSYDNSVSVLINTTPGGEHVPRFVLATSPAVGQGPIAIAAGDFNGDGKLDLVTANHFDDSLSILVNDSAEGAEGAHFRPATVLAVGSNSGLAAVAVIDLDGDGKPDLVAANDGSDSLSIFSNSSAPGAAGVRFDAAASEAVSGNLYALAAGDFNRDGKPDLVVTSGGRADDNTVSILANDTPARLPQPQSTRLYSWGAAAD